MQQRWLLNLILFVVILVLVVLLVYTPGIDKPEETPPFTDLTEKVVQTIRIERHEEETDPVIALNKQDGDWFLTQPLEMTANPFKVSNLLQILSTGKYQALKAENLNLASLKLDPPQVTLTFNDKLVLELGDSSPVGDGRRYVKKGEEVFLIDDTAYFFLTGNAASFVNLSPLGERPTIQALHLPDYHFALQENEWQLVDAEPPFPVDSSKEAINELIDNWETLQALSVRGYQSTEETENRGEVQVELADNTLNFVVTQLRPQLVLALPDKQIQYQISATQAEKLLQLPKLNIDEKERSSEGEEMPTEEEEAMMESLSLPDELGSEGTTTP